MRCTQVFNLPHIFSALSMSAPFRHSKMDFECAVLHRLLLVAVEEPAVLKSERG